MDYIKEHRTGLIGTIVTHAVVLALLLFFGFLASLGGFGALIFLSAI